MKLRMVIFLSVYVFVAKPIGTDSMLYMESHARNYQQQLSVFSLTINHN